MLFHDEPGCLLLQSLAKIASSVTPRANFHDLLQTEVAFESLQLSYSHDTKFGLQRFTYRLGEREIINMNRMEMLTQSSETACMWKFYTLGLTEGVGF